ncbi:hypothetical protein [Aquiluna sp. KACHI24]|uniref:hypothetical protein n=1 Tax=Aquiluna sp. KACHI24 TaxID=2968831 RepID=UPI00223179C9|nr:hypothetical protein [Aquiluna sp. KACHI24]
MEQETQFWFNTKTGQVETGPQALALDRIGPFASAQEAARAPEIIAERARAIAEEERLED